MERRIMHNQLIRYVTIGILLVVGTIATFDAVAPRNSQACPPQLTTASTHPWPSSF